jgi:hypothetical protein
MRICKDLPGFREAIMTGPAYLKMDIPNIAKCLEALTAQFKEQGRSADEIANLIERDIRGICPFCCTWTDGRTLAMMMVFSKFGSVMLTDEGPKSRLLKGFCVNHKCQSREIFIIWKGCENTEQQVLRHLDRIRMDAERERNEEQIKLVATLSSSQLLAFTKDTFFCMVRHCTTHHLYSGKSFPGLAIWVSVIPWTGELAGMCFPQGYRAFLAQLLEEAGYSRGDIAIAHWIFMGNAYSLVPGWIPTEEVQWHLNLTLMPRGNLGSDKKFLVLPSEFLSQKERESFQSF